MRYDNAERSLRPVATFLSLTFVLSWLIEVPAALSKYGVIHAHVSHGLQTCAQFAPALAALITTRLLFGNASLRSLLSPLVKGRAPLLWYAIVLLLPPASQYAALLLYKALGHPMPSLSPWSRLPLLVVVLALFSVGEELGWRGFFLPEIAKNYSQLTVAAWMALFWGLWHLPFYLATNSEGQNTWLLYLLFLGGILPVCVLFVLIFSSTKSLLLCMLFHGSLNAGAAFCFGPLPTGQLLPFALWIVLLWLIAIPAFVIVVRSQPKTLSAS